MVAINESDYIVQDFKVPKLPPMSTMNPEETAKPTTSEIVIPTKPTETTTTHPSASAPSTSATTHPSTSANPSAPSTPTPSPEEPSKTGKTYYVSKDGSDSNSGLEESKPLKKIQTGINKLNAGDKLIIKAGTYKEKLSIKNTGSKDKPITITTSGTVKIDGDKKGGILLKVKSGAKYVTIKNLTFQNLRGKEARGISLEPNTKNITIETCNFTNITCPKPSKDTANAIYFDGSGKSDGTAIEQIIIKNCKLSKVCPGWSEGISVDGNCKSITIDGVTSTADGAKTNIAICICGNDKETNSVNSVNRPRGVIVKNCNVSGCKSPYGQDAYGIYVDGAYDVTIESNTVSNSEGGIEVGSEKKNSSFSGKETQNVTVQNNTINNCLRGMYIGGDKEESKSGYAYNITVNNNTLNNCGKGTKYEIVTFDRCNKVSFSNNTISSKNKARIIYVRNSAKSLTFKKNSYSNGRKASDDFNFGKENSDYSFSKWVNKFNDKDSTFK